MSIPAGSLTSEEPRCLGDAPMTMNENFSAAAQTGPAMARENPPLPNNDRGSHQSVAHFLRNLFRLLDELNVRYCVMHSWNELPEGLPSDLDLAVHPEDKPKIRSLFDALEPLNYSVYQWNNYITKGHSFYFYWNSGRTLNTVAVDIIFEHRRAGMILSSGEELVSGRLRHGDFWVAPPEVEFSYLLAKKAAKGNASFFQSLRLRQLADRLGRQTAERIAGEIFRKGYEGRIVEACANGTIDDELGNLNRKPWQRIPSRHALRKIRYWAGECRRAIWRSSHPTGILLAVLGPDGVGKSTLLEGIAAAFIIPLRRRHLFHWRPQMLARRKDNRPVTNPHGQTPRGSLLSMAFLSIFFVDCWVGYLFVVKPRLVKCGLVQFDRYFHDVLVDPRRYRYGGPKWFAALLCRLLPEPDLVILLDADEDLIFTRKTELTHAEIQRQRQAYAQLRFRRAQQICVRTDAGIQPTLKASATAVAEFLRQRFNTRIRHWMSVA